MNEWTVSKLSEENLQIFEKRVKKEEDGGLVPKKDEDFDHASVEVLKSVEISNELTENVTCGDPLLDEKDLKKKLSPQRLNDEISNSNKKDLTSYVIDTRLSPQFSIDEISLRELPDDNQEAVQDACKELDKDSPSLMPSENHSSKDDVGVQEVEHSSGDFETDAPLLPSSGSSSSTEHNGFQKVRRNSAKSVDAPLLSSSGSSSSTEDDGFQKVRRNSVKSVDTPLPVYTSDDSDVSLDSRGAMIQSPPPVLLSGPSEQAEIVSSVQPVIPPEAYEQPPSQTKAVLETRSIDQSPRDEVRKTSEEVARQVPSSSSRVQEQKRHEERRRHDGYDRPDIKGSLILAAIFTSVAVIIGAIFSKRNEV